MDKIYSRPRLKLPKIKILKNVKLNNNKIALCCITIIAIITAKIIIHAISPIIDKQCINIAKSIATKVSNEEATKVMSKYKYNDICLVTKDNNRKCNNDKCKCNYSK